MDAWWKRPTANLAFLKFCMFVVSIYITSWLGYNFQKYEISILIYTSNQCIIPLKTYIWDFSWGKDTNTLFRPGFLSTYSSRISADHVSRLIPRKKKKKRSVYELCQVSSLFLGAESLLGIEFQHCFMLDIFYNQAKKRAPRSRS